LDSLSAAANTIRDRNANPAALVRRRAHPSNSPRSASVNTITAAPRTERGPVLTTEPKLMTHETSSLPR
jgi:hypothetical protein